LRCGVATHEDRPKSWGAWEIDIFYDDKLWLSDLARSIKMIESSWDWARFETCAHKWVDLSEGGDGVSLLNDCKYGHDIQNNVIQIMAIRLKAKR